MTTHEGAPMPTHPEVVTLDPSNGDDMARLVEAFYNTDETHAPTAMAKAVRALSAPPLSDEPSAWTLVATSRNNPLRVFYRVEDRPGMRRPWRHVGGGWHTWPEVCEAAREDSGGTPEVLEPDSVKALREQVTNLAAEGVVAEAERDEARATVDKVRQFATACREQYEASDYSESISLDQVADSLEGLLKLAEDEPAEPAPVEHLTHKAEYDERGVAFCRACGETGGQS